MTYILVSPSGTRYPYPLSMLRNSFPNISFPEVISDDLAEKFGCYPVIFKDRPECDPRTEKAEESEPVLTDKGWEQSWVVRDATEEEINEYDALHAEGPDWDRFKFSLLTDENINSSLVQSIQVAPAASIGIVPSLINAESGKISDFRASWLTLRRCGAISSGVAESVLALASSCNLPKEFLSILK